MITFLTSASFSEFMVLKASAASVKGESKERGQSIMKKYTN